MQFRDRISRAIHHTIRRISSSSMTQGFRGCIGFTVEGFSLLHGEFIDFKMSSSIRFRTANSSSFLNFLAIFCAIFLKNCISLVYLIPRVTSSFPFELDQTIVLPDRVPSSGIGTACQCHKEQYQHFAFPNSLLSSSDSASDNFV